MSQEAWAAALDRLEADVELAERLVGDHSLPTATPWAAPDLDGAVPADLVPRIRALLERQERALASVGSAMEEIGRQQEFVSKVSHATGRTGAAVYLDVTA